MFISGTTHQVLQLGQPLLDGPSALFINPPAEPAAAQQPVQEGKRKLSMAVKPSTSNHSTGSPAGSTKTGGSKGGPSLLDLLESGMLAPGEDNMKVTYKGNTYAGALQGNGTILFRGATFNTPSAFSVHVKRLVTPGKQGDDGWHSVYVDGVLLNAIRQQYHAKMLGQPFSKQQSNKTPRRSQSSPRGQQQQQQQAVVVQQQQGQQQQQQSGPRPPLPLPKLKLGNIKGLPQQQQQQQQGPGARVLQPAQPPEQQQQQQQPVKANPQKLKFKMSLKLGNKGGSTAAGTAAAAAQQPAAAGAVGQQQQQQQQQQPVGAPVLHCPLDPHQPVLHQGPGAQQQQQQQEAPGQPAPQWVRCCRCEQWRCVPEGCWGQVQAVGANWFCEDAGWDLKKQQPFTDACMPDVWADTPDEGLMVPAAL